MDLLIGPYNTYTIKLYKESSQKGKEPASTSPLTALAFNRPLRIRSFAPIPLGSLLFSATGMVYKAIMDLL